MNETNRKLKLLAAIVQDWSPWDRLAALCALTTHVLRDGYMDKGQIIALIDVLSVPPVRQEAHRPEAGPLAEGPAALREVNA